MTAPVHDITGWRTAERALDLSESRFRSLVMATAQVREECPSWRSFTGQGPREAQEDVESTPGAGTPFTVELPLRPPTEGSSP